MPGKLNVYTLGQHGVDLVDHPLQTVDGALLHAQNAAPSSEDAELALKKRGGMVKVNSVAAVGRVQSIFTVRAV